MKAVIFQVDAFTSIPYKGNPAAVCLLDEPAEESWMKNVAAEMNLSETAFLTSESDGYRLRWFTPAVEEELCGHATLASAHTLWETGREKADHEIRFFTRSGLLTARKIGGWIELNFPNEAPHPVELPASIAESLGIQPHYVGRNRLDYIIVVDDDQDVRKARPDFKRMADMDGRGVILTAVSRDKQYDFISRFFAPHDGIDEDPVTGSAHCCLGPYWGERLGKKEMNAFQASARGGELRVILNGDRVYLRGQAVTILRGDILA